MGTYLRTLATIIAASAVVALGIAKPATATAAGTITGGRASAAAAMRTGAYPPGAAAEAAASRRARATGHAVEVPGQQTSTTTVFAEPSGTLRAVITATPTRTRRGDAWVPIDTRLVRAGGGALSPAAVNTPVSFSEGGVGPVAAIGSGRTRLTLSWPRALPAPEVSGAVATYRDVMPGTDLRVVAGDSGFRLYLIVATRAAGERLLAKPPTLRLASPTLTVRLGQGGVLSAVNRAGHEMFEAAPAAMSDARGRTARVSASLAGDVLTMRLDPALVAEPASDYPLMVDPSFTAGLLNWTNVLALGPNTSYWNGQFLGTDSRGVVEVGDDPTYGTIARAFFQMNTSPMNGKHILGATFRITEGWATNCTPQPVQLWLTGGISTSTTWNNQPGWTQLLDTQTVAHGNPDFGCAAQAPVAFNATSAVRSAAANSWSHLTVGLRAGIEDNSSGWKRFQTDASLQIDYNSISTVGAVSTSPATSCVSGGSSPASSDPAINAPAPTLTAFADDADTAENNLRGSFVWQSWSGSAWVAAGSGTDPIGRAANTQTSFTLPAGSLVDGGIYRWQVQIIDPLQSPYTGSDLSAWSPWCEFTADFTPPPAPAVTSSDYPADGSPHGGVGTAGNFTLSSAGAGDVAHYFYGFNDAPTVQVTPSSPGGNASFPFVPSHSGPWTLFVKAEDSAGNISAQTSYTFQVSSPAPMAAQWLLADPAGTASLSDTTGNGHSAALSGGTLGVPSRIVGTTALALDGSSTNYAQTAGPVLDTSKSFTIAAWVKPAALSGDLGVLGQDGVHSSAFQLQTDQSCACWRLVLPATDAASPAVTILKASATVKTGVWTHVAAVYDAIEGTATLYVNGVPAGRVSGVTTWNATGAFAIGRDRWADSSGNFFKGSISAVQVWQRVLYASEVLAMVDPSVNALTEDNTFDQTWQCPSAATMYTMSTDGSNAAHDLVLNGAAQVTTAAAYDGESLQLDGTTGYADTSQDPACDGTAMQVLHTDQSFTVSAWVRIDGAALPTGTRTALSQSGTYMSGFYLGYRLNGTTPSWAFEMTDHDGAGANPAIAWSSGAVTTADLGRWHHLAGVFDAIAGRMTLYVDGQVAGTTAHNVGSWDATGSFMVGAARSTASGATTASTTDYWQGAIDNVRAYQGVQVGLAASWPFTGCSGTPVSCPDASGGGHSVTFSATGAGVSNQALPDTQPGPVLSLDGTAGVAVTAGPVIDTSQSFTVGAWIQMPALPSAGSHVIVSQSGTNKSSFELAYNGDSQALCFTMWASDSATAGDSQVCAPNVVAGQWMFVAGVYDTVNSTIKLYTATFTTPPALAGTALFSTPWKAGGPMRIGAGYSGGTTSFFSGAVSDVRIYPDVTSDLTSLMS